MQAARGSGALCQPPSVDERRLLDLLEQAPRERLTAILKCVPGWQFEGQANLRNWATVLDKIKAQLVTAMEQCPRLLAAAAPPSGGKTTGEARDAAMSEDEELALTEQVYEALRFSAILLENASSKHLFNAVEAVVALMGARNDNVAFEATRVVAMLALPPQQHRHAVDPGVIPVDNAASGNQFLRRRLLTIAQGLSTSQSGAEDFSDDWKNSISPTAASPTLSGSTIYQLYRSVEGGAEELVSISLTQRMTDDLMAASTRRSASDLFSNSSQIAGAVCEELTSAHSVPEDHQFQLLTRIRGVALAFASAASPSTREFTAVQRLYALLALFYLFSDSLDVASMVEQNPGLTRSLAELIRVEKSVVVPLRVRITALQVLSALVYDRAERGGSGGILGRQSNVLHALGVSKGTPHGIFPSLVRFAMSELGHFTVYQRGQRVSSDITATTGENDNDMEMSLAVAFVHATTDLVSPEDAMVLRAGLFRDPLHPQEGKLCWIEAVLSLLNHVVSIQSGAAVLTESGIIPALLHVASSNPSSAFHTSLVTLCVQALETTVNTHPAASALYRELNGVGIIIDKLHTEVMVIAAQATTASLALTETKTVLIIALLVMLSVSFHSQGVMTAGATSRVVRDGSQLSKALITILSGIDTFGPVIFAQAAIVVSDIINNDPSSVNQVHAGGIADAFLNTLTRWDTSELQPAKMLPASSELMMAIPSVLSALCLTSSHAEKVARFKPLTYLLDCFAIPSYAAENCDHVQGDVPAIVGSGVFEMMRQVSSFQTAAIQACVDTANKISRYSEGCHEDDYKTLLRMVTRFGELLEPIMSKPEHASAFADHGGVHCLMRLYRLILPTAPVFMCSIIGARGGSQQAIGRLTHQPAAQSMTLALRSFASQQPAKMLTSIMTELSRNIDECRDHDMMNGRFLSSLPDVDLAGLCNVGGSSKTTPGSSHSVETVGKLFRQLAFIEWLVSLLCWTMQAAQNGLQSRHWFSELISSSNMATLERLFTLCRAIQFERATLAATHRDNLEPASSSVQDRSKAKGVWKLCALLFLRFNLITRSLLVNMCKSFVSLPMHHRRGDDSIHALAMHAHSMSRFVASTLNAHIEYVTVSKRDSIDPFVKKYYLIFVLETIMQTIFDAKRKQANALVLWKLKNGSTFGKAPIREAIGILLQDFLEAGSSSTDQMNSRMSETCIRVCSSTLQYLGDLDTLRTSQITVSLVTNDDSTGGIEEQFDLRHLSIEIHHLCMEFVLKLWNRARTGGIRLENFAEDILPAAVVILRHRLDVGGNSQDAPPARTSGSRDRRHQGSSFGEFPAGSGLLDRDDFLQALFGGTGHSSRSRSTTNRRFEVDSATVDSLVAMGFPRPRVERAIRRIRVNDVELAMEWLLSHPDEDDGEDEEERETAATSDVGTPRSQTNSDGDLAEASRGFENGDDEKSLFDDYMVLRSGFEEGCLAVIRNQMHIQPTAMSDLQRFVITLAQYMALLSSKVEEERAQVVGRLGSALLEALQANDEHGQYVAMVAHLVAVVLQLDSNSVQVFTTRSDQCVDEIVAFMKRKVSDGGTMLVSFAPLMLVLDAIQTSDRSKSNTLNASESTNSETAMISLTTRRELIRLCVSVISASNLDRNLAHAVWQLTARLTLDHEIASEFFSAGGAEKLLDIRDDALFPGYMEVTTTILVQSLESPEVLQHMMEDKLHKAMTKLSERYGPPSQMRITPRVLLMEVASVAARNEKIFVEALRNAVSFKKSESGRVYVVDKLGGDGASSSSVDDHHQHAEKRIHKLPKNHRAQAQTVVEMLVAKIQVLWTAEKNMAETRSQNEYDEDEKECLVLGVGTYLHILSQLIETFPACSAAIVKSSSDGSCGGFIRLGLQELLPCRALCKFAAIRRSLDPSISDDSSAASKKALAALSTRTRERVRNIHKLLVAIGTQPGDGPRIVVGELVKLFRTWPGCVGSQSILNGSDLSVDDELALSALHAWSALIMSILWPRGASSKTASWDKIVLGGGLQDKYAFVTLLVDALRKISLAHPFAHATCSMVLRPLTTLTRSFVTHRVRKLLKKRNSSNLTEATGLHEAESSAHVDNQREQSTHPQSSTPAVESSSVSVDHDVIMRSPNSIEERTARDNFSNASDNESERDNASDDEHAGDRSVRGEVDDEEDEGDDDEDDEEDEEDDEDDAEDDDEDEDEDEDDDDDEDMEGADERLRIRTHRSRDSAARHRSASRSWGAFENEGGDGYDEADEEEFSYLRLLDDESLVSNQARAARSRQGARSRTDRGSAGVNNGNNLLRTLADIFNLDGGHGANEGQVGVFAFGDDEDDEDDPDMAFRHGASFRESATSMGGGSADPGVSPTLMSLLDDQNNQGSDEDFIFETVDVGASARRTLTRTSGGQDADSQDLDPVHPLLRSTSITNDNVADRDMSGLSGLLPDRLPLPRHAPSLFRELNVLVRQMNSNLHLAPGARTLLGRDLLRHGGSRNRPPSRNRLSAVSNLLSEFSLDIPTSHGVFGGRAGHGSRYGIGANAAVRRADRILGGRGLRGDMMMDSTSWGGQMSGNDARSIASRLEQYANQLIEPDQARSSPPSSDEVPAESDDQTADAGSLLPRDDSAALPGSTRNESEDVELAQPNDAASDTASVIALASTLGESSLRSPHDEVSESEAPTSPVLSATSVSGGDAVVSTSELGGMPPPAPTVPPSNDMMNFTLDLSSFGQPTSSLPVPPTEQDVQASSTAGVVEEEMKSDEEISSGSTGFVCPEGVDPEVFAFLPPDMQAEIVAQHAPPAAPSQSTTQPGVSSGGTEEMSQIDIDMANSSFDRETLEALPPDIRAEVLANERREREAAERAAAAPADPSRAEEMDNASFVASLAPGLREEILTTCDDAFLQTLPSQVQAEAMVLRERAAYRPVFQESESSRRTGADDDPTTDIFRRPTLRRMLTSHGADNFSASGRRSGRPRYPGESSSGRRGRSDHGVTHPGMVRVEKEEEEAENDRILEDRSVKALLRLLFMARSIVQNRVYQRLITNVCLYPLTRESVRLNLLRIASTPLSQSLVMPKSSDEKDDFPPSGLYGTNSSPSAWTPLSPCKIPTEVLRRVLSVLVSLAKHNVRFTVEMLGSHGMARTSGVSSASETGAEVLIELLRTPIVSQNVLLLETLLELIELVLLPLNRFPSGAEKPSDEEKKEEDSSTSSDWIRVPEVCVGADRMCDVVSVLTLNICSPSMQDRTVQILKLLSRVPANRPLITHALVQHAKMLTGRDKFRSEAVGQFESSAVLKSAQDELQLLRILHSLSDVCETTADFSDCCASIGLDGLWDALSSSLDEARIDASSASEVVASSGSSSPANRVAPGASGDHSTEDEQEGMVIEGKSAGASCAMAALLARFLPMVEAFFVVSARDAVSMPLRVPDSNEREEAFVNALREGGLDTIDSKTQEGIAKIELKRHLSSASEAGDSSTNRLANFVEANRVLLNLLVREKPSLLDSSLAALVKLPRCRAYLDFDNKRTYFQSAMKRLRQTALRSQVGNAAVRLSVRRDHIFEDSYYALRMRSGAELRRKLHIAFTGEEGIDAGGVTREWYVILAREIFNPNYVLFTSAADSPTFQPNPLSYVNKDHLSYFEFVGKVIGKAVADGQLLDAHFTRSFYKHILQLPISYHDMEAIDPEYYRNLHSILDNDIESLGLELTFSAEQSNFGRVEIVDLIPNGRNIAVTDENKMEYVKLVTHHRMATGIRQQIDAFLKGFHQLVPPEMISIFNENELELLISGMPEIDIDDLKANTDYANYKPTDAVIRWFWNVLYSFNHEERALFLQFVTGTSKVPLEGFKALEGMRGTHKFNIHKAFGNPNALPSAHTCFNQLDLPEYESEEKLRQCLLLAIREGSEGFGFG